MRETVVLHKGTKTLLIIIKIIIYLSISFIYTRNFKLARLHIGTWHSSSLHCFGDLPLNLHTTATAIGGFASSPREHPPRSRPSERPVKLRCVSSPSTPLRAQCHTHHNSPFIRSRYQTCQAYRCHSPSVLSRALPSAASRAAQPHDSPSALRHGANNRQKGALCAFPPAGYYGHEERLNWIFLPRFRLNVKVLTLNARFGVFSVNSARKPEGVGVRGQGKVAFSHALRLPLPRKLNVTITEVGPAIMWPGPRLSSLQEKVSDC